MWMDARRQSNNEIESFCDYDRLPMFVYDLKDILVD